MSGGPAVLDGERGPRRRWAARIFVAHAVRVALCGALLSAAAPGCAPSLASRTPATATPVSGPRIAILDEHFASLRADFDRDAGGPRLLLLVSPTCGECLHGVDVIDREILAALPDPSLRVYLVWLPVLVADDLAAAHRAGAALASRDDPRLTQYWDPDLRLGRALGATLAIPARNPASATAALAWDVYLVYDPGRRFGASPPAPDFFMHQLDALDRARHPFLDGKTLRDRLASRGRT